MNPHLAGVAALLHAEVPGLHVYVTEAERPDYDPTAWDEEWTGAQKQAWTLPDRYVVIAAPVPFERSHALSGGRRDIHDYWTVTTAANSRWKFDWIASRVRAALHPGAPEVEGFEAFIELSNAVVVGVDKDVDPHMHYCADSYVYDATPA